MVQFNKNRIEINGNVIELPYSILDAKEFEQSIVVIFDYMEFNKNSVARNLHCIDQNGSVLWIAENPTTKSSDAYVNFAGFDLTNKQFTANNFSGFTCAINLENGKLLKSVFTK